MIDACACPCVHEGLSKSKVLPCFRTSISPTLLRTTGCKLQHTVVRDQSREDPGSRRQVGGWPDRATPATYEQHVVDVQAVATLEQHGVMSAASR